MKPPAQQIGRSESALTMTIKTIDVIGDMSSISCTITLDFSFKITPK